jgi:pimeloyl-ACP methyl ester carboxylesterase
MNRFLGLIICIAFIAFFLTGCSTYSKVAGRNIDKVSVTAQQKALTKSMKPFAQQPMVRLGRYLDAVNTARLRLRDSPTDTLAQSDYSFAVGRIVEIIDAEGLTPWDAPMISPSASAGQWSFTLAPPDPRPEYHTSNFEMLPADRYEFKGTLIGERNVKQGLGAPVVVVGKDLDFTRIDEFSQGKQVYYGMTAVIRFGEAGQCEMTMVDPLESETITLDESVYPVAADFQAPLALSLAELAPQKSELGGWLKPEKHIETARLARLQPYNPNKIPVLCIHGLGDSVATWMPLIDSLRRDEQIREHYQFWFFSYPTGFAYPIVTAYLREKLDQFDQRFPDHRDMVLLGHSMGGMISRLLITDSGNDLWDIWYDRPPDQLAFSPEVRATLTDALIFKARPDIARVVFASPSHRGSDEATSTLGKIGSALIGNPFLNNHLSEEAISNMRVELRDQGRHRLPNSVELLEPDNRFLNAINAIPTKSGIPFHTIIGDRGKGGYLDRTKPMSSDGVVPYWSSHMDGAVSETIIPSDHWSIRHPLGMAETKRILLFHLRNL